MGLILNPDSDERMITVPQTDLSSGNHNLFVVTNGPIVLTGLAGRVTTATSASPASNLKFVFDPEVSGLSNSDISTALSFVSLTANTVLVVNSGLTLSKEANRGLFKVFPSVDIPSGTLMSNLTATLADGAVEWTIRYIPMRSRTRVRAA